MLNLLFWNLFKKNNESILADLFQENAIDIFVFAEYQSTDLSSLISNTGNRYAWHNGYGGCDKVTLIARNNIIVDTNREQSRYTLYSCTLDGCIYIIAGIHLPSNPTANEEHRKNVIRDLVQDIIQLEKEQNNSNTIVIGDFNANPFDSELIQKDAFNAVLYKQLIEQHEYCVFEKKRYRRFYNPMVNYITEEPKNYGSYYRAAGISSLYWFCYDQVIVRKQLVSSIVDVRYFTEINRRSLIKKTSLDEKISDHLPLLVRFERMV